MQVVYIYKDDALLLADDGLLGIVIPPWGVVILHIGVGHSQTPMYKTTPQGVI